MSFHRIFQLLRSIRFFVSFAALGGIASVCLLSNTLLNEKIKGIDRWFQATKIHYEIGARVKFHEGRYSEAIAAATRSLALEPAFAPAYNLRGKSYALLAEHQAAIEDFTKVIRLHPNHAEGYRNLGFSYFMNNDPENAIIYLEKSLGLNPGDKKVLDTLERLKEKLAADH